MRLAISVVIPTANHRPHKLLRAIQSVCQQARGALIGPIDLIVSNNSSRLLPPAVVALAQRRQLRIVESGARRGVSYARNRGVAATRYETVAFLDDDDWWEATFLLEMGQAMREQQVDLVWCGRWDWKTESSKSPGIQPDHSVTKKNVLIEKTSLGGSNIMISKGVYIQLGGFDEKLLTSEDRDFFTRFLNQNYKFYAVKNRLVNVDRTPDVRLTQPSADKVASLHLLYHRYAAEMSAETKREYLFKLLFIETLSTQSSFGLIRLLFTYPHKQDKLKQSLKTMICDRHPRFYMLARWGIRTTKATGIWKYVSAIWQCFLTIRRYFSSETSFKTGSKA
jgi:glycosyltransferase involved in cell wall biosynthesis